MLQMLRSLFSNLRPAPRRNRMERTDIAIGALLVRIAKVDGAYLFQETEQIERVLAARYALTGPEAAALRAECEALEEEMPSALELMGHMQADIPAEERAALVSALWSVVFADRIEHADEDELIQVIEDVLGVPRAQSLALRAQEFSRANPVWGRPPQLQTPPRSRS